MSVKKLTSIEDGNLNVRPITSSIQRENSDIDCSFTVKPSGDIYKKTEASSVAQSVKNLLLCNRGSKPFAPRFSANLEGMLFELGDEFDDDNIKSMVRNAINNYEPRAKLQRVTSKFSPDYNSLDLTITFQVISTLEQVSLNVNIARIR